MPVFLACPYHTKSGRRPAIEPPYKSGPEPYSFVTLHKNRANFWESGERAVPMAYIRRLRGYGNPQSWLTLFIATVRKGRANKDNPQSASRTAPLPKEPFGQCASLRHLNTKPVGAYPPNAPFFERGWQRASADGGLPYSSSGASADGGLPYSSSGASAAGGLP